MVNNTTLRPFQRTKGIFKAIINEGEGRKNLGSICFSLKLLMSIYRLLIRKNEKDLSVTVSIDERNLYP